MYSEDTMLLREIYDLLTMGDGAVCATIVAVAGSVPRTSGSKMVIYPDGSIKGTIGGGAVEGDVIVEGVKLYDTRKSIIKSYDLNVSDNKESMDIVCGGHMQVLIEFISDSPKIFKSALDHIYDRESFMCITDFTGLQKTAHIFIFADGTSAGGVIPAEHLKLFEGENQTVVNIDGNNYFVEQIKPQETVYLAGGGHISKELAELCDRLNFRVVVIDDRGEYADRGRFPFAEEVLVKEGFEHIFVDFLLDENSYVVILTRGHQFDKESLAQALRTEAGYIGMIGSTKKRDTVYKSLFEEGFTDKDIERVHCPVGLSIGGDTPAEIALSIAAELIQHRYKK